MPDEVDVVAVAELKLALWRAHQAGLHQWLDVCTATADAASFDEAAREVGRVLNVSEQVAGSVISLPIWRLTADGRRQVDERIAGVVAELELHKPDSSGSA